MTPTASFLPPLCGHVDDPATRHEYWAIWCQFLFPFNLAGLPALSVPAGLSRDGLPIGVQFVGGPWREDLLFGLAASVELAHPWDAAPVARPDI